MIKRITKQDRRLIRMIDNRRAKGMTWQEIADCWPEKFRSAAGAYNWYFDRVPRVN